MLNVGYKAGQESTIWALFNHITGSKCSGQHMTTGFSHLGSRSGSSASYRAIFNSFRKYLRIETVNFCLWLLSVCILWSLLGLHNHDGGADAAPGAYVKWTLMASLSRATKFYFSRHFDCSERHRRRNRNLTQTISTRFARDLTNNVNCGFLVDHFYNTSNNK